MSNTRPLWPRVVSAVTVPVLLLAAACGGGGGDNGGDDGSGGQQGGSSEPTSINVALVSNPDMQRMEKLLPEFEKAHPNVKVKFTVLDEITLRDKLSQDITTQSGQFDVAMVGVVETPVWARNDWLVNLKPLVEKSPDYAVDDLLPPIRDGLSVDGNLYAVPLNGESSFLYYRKDLFDKAGLTMPEQPTWDQVKEFAAKLTDRKKDVAGICLRGQAGWGSNMPTIATMIHQFGGRLYDQNFKGGLDSPEAKRAVQTYIDIITEYGEKGAANSSFQECQNLFNQGKTAMWYDATSVASATFDKKGSKFADQTAVANTPNGTVDAGGWLWAWSFVMIKTSKKQDAAWEFMQWATSKEYIELAGKEYGWNLAPPGTRTSTYENSEYQKAAKPYAELTLATINRAKVKFDGAAAEERSFYVDIPEWPATGDKLGKLFAAAIVGDKTVDEAMKEANDELNKTAKDGGYAK